MSKPPQWRELETLRGGIKGQDSEISRGQGGWMIALNVVSKHPLIMDSSTDLAAVQKLFLTKKDFLIPRR